MLFYNIQPRKIEDVVTWQPEQLLMQDGSNLASVFTRLGMSSPEVVERINEYLRLILPGLRKVSASLPFAGPGELLTETQKVALFFEQRLADGGMHGFWASQMSDGTLRSLGILTALLQAAVKEGPRPSLVAIEEPEAQVHPAMLGVLRDAMVEASYSTQVLVTTQSADLLDNKDVQTDSILVATADEGATRIATINEAGRDLIRRRLYSPGELLRIGQLFPGNGHADGSAALPQPEKSGERP
jgi:predicted ATPase